MDCPLCKNGQTQPGHVTVTRERDNSIILLKNVPAQVCDNCSNYFLDAATNPAGIKGEQALESGAELKILRLQAT